MLYIVAIGCICLSALTPTVRKSLKTVKAGDALQRRGARVVYDWEGGPIRSYHIPATSTVVEGTVERRRLRLGGLVVIGGEDSITSIEFTKCNVGLEDFALMADCGKVTRVALTDCDATDWGRVQTLPEMQLLEIKNTPLNTLKPLGQMDLSSLQSLALVNVSIPSTAVCSLRQCTSLIDLDISRNPICDDGFFCISELNCLQRIVAEKTGLGDRGLGSLTRCRSLEWIDASDTQVTGQGLVDFIDNSQIKTVLVGSEELINHVRSFSRRVKEYDCQIH